MERIHATVFINVHSFDNISTISCENIISRGEESAISKVCQEISNHFEKNLCTIRYLKYVLLFTWHVHYET